MKNTEFTTPIFTEDGEFNENILVEIKKSMKSQSKEG